MLNFTGFTQPALLAARITIWRVRPTVNGVSPSHFADHSLGEYSALVEAGAISLGDAEQLGFEPFSNQIR